MTACYHNTSIERKGKGCQGGGGYCYGSSITVLRKAWGKGEGLQGDVGVVPLQMKST